MSHDDGSEDLKPIALLVESTAALLRLATVHDSKNPVFTPALQQFAAHYQAVNPSDLEVTLSLVDESIFLNRQLVRLTRNQVASVASLRKVFDRLQIDELIFAGAQPPEAMREFLGVFQKHWGSSTPQLLKDDAAATNIRLRKLDSKRVASNVNSIRLDPRQNVLRCYAALTIAIRKALEQMHAGAAWRSPDLRRAVQQLAEASDGRESLLAGLTRFPNFVGDLHFHLAAVTALTLIMCRKLGLKRAALTDVCMAATLHDIGRFTMKRAKGQPENEAEQSRASVESLLRNSAGATSEELFVQASASYECALPHQPRPGGMAPSTLAQLIAVPCAFDLLSMPRPPPHNVGPDQALRLIQEQAGTKYDPSVVSLFRSVMGVYPVGTTVTLSNDAIAIVLEVPSNPLLLSKPVVKVVRDARGASDYVVDLSQEANLSITGTADPVLEGVKATFFLLA